MTDATLRLDSLSAFVADYDRRGKTPRQFWDEFWARAGDALESACGPEADPAVICHFCEIQAAAHDAGYVVPDDRLDEVM